MAVLTCKTTRRPTSTLHNRPGALSQLHSKLHLFFFPGKKESTMACVKLGLLFNTSTSHHLFNSTTYYVLFPVCSSTNALIGHRHNRPNPTRILSHYAVFGCLDSASILCFCNVPPPPLQSFCFFLTTCSIDIRNPSHHQLPPCKPR